MMDQSVRIEAGLAAAIAELRRQGEQTGCDTDIHDDFTQIDGPFYLRPVVRAIIKAVSAR